MLINYVLGLIICLYILINRQPKKSDGVGENPPPSSAKPKLKSV